MSTIHEFTEPVLAARPATSRARSVRRSSAQQGLYAFAFRNDDPDQVYDKIGDGTVVVRARGASIKPGKFEQSFRTRIANYDYYLHRKRSGGVFDQSMWACLIGGFVLDLSSLVTVAPAAHIFEAYLVHAVNTFLGDNQLFLPKSVSRQHRGEGRCIKPDAWNDVMHVRLGAYLTEVAARIDLMAAAAVLPPRRP